MAKTRIRRQRRYLTSTLTHQAGLRPIPRHRIEIDWGLSWHVIFCRAQQERQAQQHLQAAGFATYRPTQLFERNFRGKISVIERVPVSRYLFVGLNPAAPDLDGVNRALGNNPVVTKGYSYWSQGFAWFVPDQTRMKTGMGDLVRVNDTPIRIGAGILQRFEDAVNGSGGVTRGPDRFSVGQTVFVKDGPFSGIPFSIESLSDYRVRGLVDLLGGKVAVDLELEQLEAA
jgi:hypothetical protein